MSTLIHPSTKATEAHNDAILERLRLTGVRVPAKDAWKKTVGWAKNRPLHADAVKAGAEWREEMNRRSIEEAKAGRVDS